MNKTYKKLGRRSIKRSINRFIAILGIVAMGTGFLAGLLATTPDMKENSNDYFNEKKLYDFYVQSNLGFKERDRLAVNKKSFVKDTTLLYEKDAVLKDKFNEKEEVRISYVDFNNLSANKFELQKGRIPHKKNECFAVSINPYRYTIKIGDEFKSENEIYKVVGIGGMPQFISTIGDFTNIGTGTIKIALYTPEYKEREIYTAMYVRLKDEEFREEYKDTFSKDYKNKINKAGKKLDILGEYQSKIRRNEIVKKAQRKLDKKIKNFKEKKKKTYDKLEVAKSNITYNERKISFGFKRIKNIKKTLYKREAKLKKQENILLKQKTSMTALENAIENNLPVTQKQKLVLKKYKNGLAKIKAGKASIYKHRLKLKKEELKLKKANQKIIIVKKNYKSSKVKADVKFAKAERKIKKAQIDINNIKKGKWYIRSRLDNPGISRYKSDVEKVGLIAKVFPAFFFLVAALVVLTSMTRMIEEERQQIGVLKSMGYSNASILIHYEKYGVIATLAGSILGESLGFVVFPKVISNAYRMMYNLPVVEVKWRFDIALFVTMIILCAVIISIFFASKDELKEKPAYLLMAKAPKAGKRILLEKISPLWSRITFSHKVTLRNLFRYKKRFLMTIVGVAGCFALLLAGFGVRDSIGNIVNLQYKIYKYDLQISIEEKVSAQDFARKDFYGITKKEVIFKDVYTFKYNHESEIANFVVPEDSKNINTLIDIREMATGEKIHLNKNGVVITEKLSSIFNIRKGDSFYIKDKNGQNIKLKVNNIAENYIENNVYCSKEYYELLFNSEPIYNNIIAKVNPKLNRNDIVSRLTAFEDIIYILDSKIAEQNFADSVKNIDYIVIVLIISAGILAMIVLYNLINLNICERKKELATLKVLGFFEKEMFSYIFREIYMLSFMGILVGIPTGIILHKFVIVTSEVSNVMFGREIYLQSYILSAIITIIFTITVNLFMRRNIRSINMVESMKSVD